jgi:hypothetical protein
VTFFLFDFIFCFSFFFQFRCVHVSCVLRFVFFLFKVLIAFSFIVYY